MTIPSDPFLAIPAMDAYETLRPMVRRKLSQIIL
jgi:hypothetical protein